MRWNQLVYALCILTALWGIFSAPAQASDPATYSRNFSYAGFYWSEEDFTLLTPVHTIDVTNYGAGLGGDDTTAF